ncbi:MAG: hypothetical protein PVG30_08530 [Gammaproteobacteria bacterium]|jgi:hypothetical protein
MFKKYDPFKKHPQIQKKVKKGLYFDIPKKPYEIPDGLNLDPKIAKKIAKFLKEYTKEGILTILEINPDVQVLHKLWMAGKFHAVLKPLSVKSKSAKRSALSPFIIAWQKEYMLGEHKFKPIDLEYPMEHLRYLCEQAKCVKILSAKNGILKIQDTKTSERKVYIIKIKGLKSCSKTFFKSQFYKKDQMIKICEENGKPIKVQGIFENGKWKPIIADIDVHNFGEKTTNTINCLSNNTSYNTTFKNVNRKDKTIQLKQALRREIKKSPKLASFFTKKELKILFNIPNSLGKISAKEYLILCGINKACGRMVVQHGYTAQFPSKKPLLIPRNKFPSIEYKKYYGALFSSGHVINLWGIAVLAFYKLMNKHGYNFYIHQSWAKDMKKITDYQGSQMERTLIRYGLIKKRKPINTTYRSAFNLKNK